MGLGEDLISPSVRQFESALSDVSEPVPSRRASDRLTYWTGLAIAALTWILSTYLVLTTLVAVYRFYCPVPYGDMWWFVRDMARLSSHQVGLSYLWDQHSEHRIVLPRLIFWADVHLDHFRGVFTILCSSLLLVGEGLLLSFSFARILESGVASKFAYAALVFGMMFSAAQIENLMFPFQVQFPLAFFAASASIILVLRHCQTAQHRWTSLAMGIAMAVCATLSLGCGLLVWPVLLLVCVVERPHKNTIWTVAVAGIAMWITYFVGYVSPGDSARPWISLGHPGQVASFMFMFLFSPIHSTPPPASGVLGVLLLLGAAVGAFLYLRFSSAASRGNIRFFIYLGLFIMATALLTSLCRVNYGIEEAATIRYRLPVLIFWACIIALTSSLATSGMRPVFRSLGTPIVALLFVALALIPAQQPTISRFGDLSRQIDNESIALVLSASHGTCSELFRLRPDLVCEYRQFLRQNHLSLFADRSFHGK